MTDPRRDNFTDVYERDQRVMALRQAFFALRDDADRLRRAVAGAAECPAWAFDAEGDESVADARRARAMAAHGLAQLDYEDYLDPGETAIYPGLMGLESHALALAQALNERKAAFREACKAIQVWMVDDPDRAGQKIQVSKLLLRRWGGARVNKQHAFRQAVILDTPPQRAAFTWACTKKVARLTVAEARAKVKDHVSGARAPEVLRALDALPEADVLAWVDPPRVHPRVNLVLADGTRTMRPASLPVVFPAAPGDVLPDYRPLPETRPDGPRGRHGDRKLEDAPLVPEVPLYRYRATARA